MLGTVVDPGADAPNPLAHSVEGRAAIPDIEGLPSQPVWEVGVASKIGEPADGVLVLRLELEEERRPDLTPKAPMGGWRPEVHFVQAALGEQELVPAVIRNGDGSVHFRLLPLVEN
jgi:hypothetical protein